MPRNLVMLCAVLGLGAGTALGAYPVIPLVLDGGNVTLLNGTGAVTAVDYVQVNNAGEWFVEVDTDYAVGDEDGALLRGYQFNPYFSYFMEYEPLSTPPGTRVGSFDSNILNNAGNASFNLFLDGATTSTDSGVFFNKNIVIQESNISTAPQFSAGTPYIGWFETRLNDNNQILMMASVDDPAIATTVDRAIVRIDNPGGVFTETVIAKEGDELLTGRFVSDFGTDPHKWAFNNSAEVMYFADLDGDTTTDGTIWINSSLIAQEGSPAPIAGRNWSMLSSTQLDMNNSGDYVHSGSMDGDSTTNSIIVKNGQKFIQEGDTLPDIAGWTFTSFGSSAPVCIDESGNILWYGDWNDPDTTRDKGLFLNDELIVQEGVTLIEIAPGDFRVVDTIRGITEGFAFSDNGEWVIFRGVLEGNIDGAFLIYVPEPASLLLIGALLLIRRR